MFLGELFEARGDTVEAHGIKGFNRTPWRRAFKSTEAMLAWAEKYDAEILGTRDLEAASQSRLAPAIAEDAANLNVSDPVIITGDVQFNGATGDIVNFGQNNAFVVVDLYNHGRHSFHSSDVSYNDYADSDEEEARMYDDGEFPEDFEESATLYDETKPVEESHKLPGESDEDYLDRRNAQRKKVGKAGPLIYDGARNKDEVRKNYSDTIGNKPVKEAKGLKKKVRVVKGPANVIGRVGYIGEVRHGLYKGAPKTFTVDFDDGSSIQLPGSSLRLVKEPVTEFRDALTLKPGMLVNHPLVGNARIVWIEGSEVKIEAVRDGKFYKVQLTSLKAGPMKMDERDEGISKDAETKFHSELDKLVHTTFGKRKDEMAEDGGPDEGPTQFFVAMYDGNENTAFVGQLLKRDGQWYERRIAGTAPYSWGSKTYQSYLSVKEIMSWLDRDYGDEGNEVEGPFATAQEAREFAEHQYVPLGEAKMPRKGSVAYNAAMQRKKQDSSPEAIKRIEKVGNTNHQVGNAKVKHTDESYSGRKDVPGFMSGE